MVWTESHWSEWVKHLIWGKRGESWSGTGGLHQCVKIPQSWGKRRWSHTLLGVCPVTGQETMHGHKLKLRMFPLNMMENIFYCVSDWTLAEVVQGGCGVSILGHIQKPAGVILGKCLRGGPAWAGGWIRWAPKIPSNLSHSLVTRRIKNIDLRFRASRRMCFSGQCEVS